MSRESFHAAALGTSWRALAERRLEDNEGLIQQIKASESLYAELKDLYEQMKTQRDEWKQLYLDTRAILTSPAKTVEHE